MPDLKLNSENPLLKKTFEVPFDRILAEHIEPAMGALIADAQAGIDAIVALPGQRTYDNTLGALESATDNLEWAATVVGHLESVATYAEWREAYVAVQPKLSAFSTGVILNPGLWKALKDLKNSPSNKDLDTVRQRHLDHLLDEFRRQGAELRDEDKERIKAINMEFAEITTKFSQNVLDSTNAFELIVEDESRLSGLPISAKDAARESAESKGRSGWRFTLQEPSVTPIMRYLDDRDIRKQVWLAYSTRATEGVLDNRPIIARILELRKEKANILGYPDFADLVLEDRMAKTGEAAQHFITDLAERTADFFKKETKQLQDFAEREFGVSGSLMPWDIEYFSEKQRAALFSFDEEALRPYFPADNVLKGLFETVSRLYGVSVERDDSLPTWDPDVTTYRLVGEHGTHLASFYVDLYPRENKRGGAWMNQIVIGIPPEPHLGLICANANPPVGDVPALLTHREVETLFHEFGHLMHLCLSQVPVRSLSGVNVAWDFVELPSQIMENWCWEKQALDTFATHYETGETIPDELFQQLAATRTYRAATAQMRQLGFALTDMSLHRDFDPSGAEDVIQYARGIVQRFHPATLPEDYAFIAGFGHLFSSEVGYAAGYYSYKWAEVLDADAFTKFRDAGIFDRKTGLSFRQNILAKGDSEPPSDLYEAFMGRSPSLSALMERQGLVATS